jgi:hypothetical protein
LEADAGDDGPQHRLLPNFAPRTPSIVHQRE